MNRSASFTTMCTAVSLFVAGGTASPGVLEFEDKDEWLDAVGRFVTADFTGFEPGTVITDQYADLGVLFTDGFYTVVCCSKNTYPEDGAGLDGNGNITVVFDTPMAYIGVDYPGLMQIELFSRGRLIYTSSLFSGDPVGNFAGLISSELFDSAVLICWAGFEAEIDDLHFGPPDCPADLDGDDTVGILDLLALLAAWGADPGGPPDFDGDGTVGILDLLTLLANWGPCA